MDRARQEVAKELTAVAGEKAYSDLNGLINEYSNALTSGDDARADEVLARIGERFQREDVGGDAARIINQARAYQSALETRLSSELRRIETLAPTYRENPQEFIKDIEAVCTDLATMKQQGLAVQFKLYLGQPWIKPL